MSIDSNIRLKVFFLLLITLPLYGHTTTLICRLSFSDPDDRSLFVTFPELRVAYKMYEKGGRHMMNFLAVSDTQTWITVWAEIPLETILSRVEVTLPETFSGPDNPLKEDIETATQLTTDRNKNHIFGLNQQRLSISIDSALNDLPHLSPTINLIGHPVLVLQHLLQMAGVRTLEQLLPKLNPQSTSYNLQLVNPQFISLWVHIAKQMANMGTGSSLTDRLQRALAKLLFWQGQPNIPYLFQTLAVQSHPQFHISALNNPEIVEVIASGNDLIFDFTQDLFTPSEFFLSLTPMLKTSASVRLLRPQYNDPTAIADTYCCACVLVIVFLVCFLVKAGTSL